MSAVEQLGKGVLLTQEQTQYLAVLTPADRQRLVEEIVRIMHEQAAFELQKWRELWK